MKIVCAPDSFKGSLSGNEAAEAMARGIARACSAGVVCLPVSDGGEGFAEAIGRVRSATRLDVDAVDSLGRPVSAPLWIDGPVIVCEAASVCGLDQIDPAERDIMGATSRGLGQLLKAALDREPEEILIGLGGTGTNDGGAGMLAELGARFLGPGGDCEPSPRDLAELETVDLAGLDSRLAETRIRVALDVQSPLVGPHGASAVFGPQKGASPADIEVLDDLLGRLARLCGGGEDVPGGGAAGGIGWALRVCGGELCSGIDLAMEAVGMVEAIAGADLVLTGEGRIDRQTLMGKAPAGVARLASSHSIPVVALAGRVEGDLAELYEAGFTAVLPIVPGPCEVGEAMEHARENLERAAETIIRIMMA